MSAETKEVEQQVRELAQQWADAERRGDAGALDDLLVDDFRAVGPLGFVLTKQQWLDRYRASGLENTSFTFDEVEVRVYGETAIAIGKQTQTGSVQDHPTDGLFRVTQTLIRRGAQWLIAGIHLSPIALPGQPPSAGQGPARG